MDYSDYFLFPSLQRPSPWSAGCCHSDLRTDQRLNRLPTIPGLRGVARHLQLLIRWPHGRSLEPRLLHLPSRPEQLCLQVSRHPSQEPVAVVPAALPPTLLSPQAHLVAVPGALPVQTEAAVAATEQEG